MAHWKDSLNKQTVRTFAETTKTVYRSFNSSDYVRTVTGGGLEELELKDRISLMARCLRYYLPKEYGEAVKVLIDAAPRTGGWGNWVLTSYVEQFGLDHFDESVAAMEELTKYGSAEFAIRPFMIRYPDRMLAVLRRWAQDPNEHVRRLAAEGSRPRGVWVAHIERFKEDPRPVIELLEVMKADSSAYVRKAVANNLNDISKDHPGLAIETALRWKQDGHRHTDWIVKHACRTLIKKGDPRVFSIFDFTSSPQVTVQPVVLSKGRLKIGAELTFTLTIRSAARKDQRLAIDYRVHYVKADGRRSPRVFKLVERSLEAGNTIVLSKKHSFADNSTRRHYPGKHRIEIVINGVPQGEVEFTLRR